MRSALSSRAFRRLFAGALASNIGTWMQNVTLISLAYALTGDAWFTGSSPSPSWADALPVPPSAARSPTVRPGS
jgi:hypothetical protein